MNMQRHTRLSSLAARLIAVAGLSIASLTATAATISLDHRVGPKDNLFFEDWGHGYDSDYVTGNPALNGIEAFGLNAGVKARAVQNGGSAFNFADFDFIDVGAVGKIYDKNPSTWTDPDGRDQRGNFAVDDINNPGRWFRDLEVYSLIGIWSSTADKITPIGALGGPGEAQSKPAFSIGRFNTLFIPTGAQVFLFLANNDGWFDDNEPVLPPGTVNWYDVTITADNISTPVPLPAPLVLLGGALFALLGFRRR
jgi:hypothetical protein